ncbi:hypothetical protein DFP72DRAFT_823348 [Ephemerocybe angulata]|uniref:CxC2-like cysteine cluster KDZ transposase-associated domain-containing protein n=1 Tax=Ephemerocybe angulata TaxID=980116 RepID=A0A8H6HFT4_9AGAR|nr:hypothetical protein DFP72DRAFT_823348 [Tulosesus angulatus]
MPPKKRVRAAEFSFLEENDPGAPSQETAAYNDEHSHYESISGVIQQTDARAAVPPSPVKKRVTVRTQEDPEPDILGSGNSDSNSGRSSDDVAWLEAMSQAPSLWDEPEPEPDPGKGEDGSKKKRKRTQADDPLGLFTGRLDEYVEEMLRLEGFGDAEDVRDCHHPGCRALPIDVIYRCRDCSVTAVWCKSCVVQDHTQMYLHRIEKWNGKFFERVTLKSLGLRIQLGHKVGVTCSMRRAAFDDSFYIIDSDGIHPVGLDFCGCHQGITPVRQLLRERLFPATTIDPRTACTFRVLETFQMLSFTGKISAYEFLAGIFRRTDNTWNDRNKEFMRMVHEYRHLRSLKRFGRGHEPGGAAGTKEGELALLCPACPHMGINMPSKWKSIPRAKRWLYALFVAMDANFRLRRKDVSSDARDPGFNRGFAYIVWEKVFKEFLETHGKNLGDEKSACNNHDAIKSANVRGARGVAASGLGGTECARHDMRRAMGAADLQKGERYINMDYIMLSTLRSEPTVPRILNLSYDIGCQWIINLMQRCNRYGDNVFTKNDDFKVNCLVPKFHLAAHVASCQTEFSFNLTPGVGRTDGEAPERGWALSNKLAASTREMGPGNRRDTLDDSFGDMNWTKTVGIAHTLAIRAEKALVKRKEQVEAFQDFAAALPLKSRRKWTRLVRKWEKDHDEENPYENEQTALTQQSVRNRLAKEDQKALSDGVFDEVHSDVTPSVFILQGLEIEEAQRRLQKDAASLTSGSTDLERSTVLERGNALYRRIEGWVALQRLYAPKGARLRDDSEDRDTSVLSPWSISLHLPSDSATTLKCYDRRLVRYEFHFRIAQAETTLKSLRGLLLYQSHMANSKAAYASGTEANTRSNTLLQEISDRIATDVSKYRKCRERLCRLWASLADGPMTDFEAEKNWERILLPLEDADVASVTSLQFDGFGEGDRGLTWIWTVAGTGHDLTDIANTGKCIPPSGSLRIEFCRTRARAHRWQEECLLLAAEMRRVELFFQWDAKRWVERAERLSESINAPLDTSFDAYKQWQIESQKKIDRGKAAFAWRQAEIRKALFKKAQTVHGNLIERLETDSDIVECDE